MKKLTLIGGAPLSGKTTLSKKIANEDNATELSSDSVRSWMKKLLPKAKYPDLFYSDGMTAEEFYQKYITPESVVNGEIAEGKQVEKGIISLLETEITWEHLVIEGIAITPEFMRFVEKEFNDREIELFIMVDENKTRIKERISGRGLWGPLYTYPSSLIPKEVEWVVLYNKWFEEQAKKYNIEIRYN